MSVKLKKYTKEFKDEAVTLAIKSASISATARELGLPLATLHAWVQKLKHPPLNAINQNDVQSTTPNNAMLLEENRRLQKALAIAQEEKEILKKAAAYFAQHQK